MVKSNISSSVLLAGIIIICAIFIAKLTGPTQVAYGSVARSGEYVATTTRSAAGTAMLGLQLVSATTTNSGTLGSVVITGAAAGEMNFYDATTSDVTKRAASMSSTTILIASIPVSAAAGTYTFDTFYLNGLLIENIGTTPTSTITYRVN